VRNRSAATVKIAYLILAHNNPGVLGRAIRRLSTNDCGFFIHIDKKSDIAEFSSIRGGNVHFCRDRVPVYWGDFSQIQAILRLLRTALEETQLQPDYYVLMSGSDYPLRTSKYIQGFLEENFGVEFMNLVKVPAPGKPLSRINTLWVPSSRPVRQFVMRALGRVGLAQRDYRRHIGDLQPYSGSEWWALTREACQYLLDFVEKTPRFVRFFENVFAADEAFFQTILGNSSFRARIRRNLHYEDWSATGSHPSMITAQHLDRFGEHNKVMVSDIFGTGEALFARKFSDGDLQLLQRIDDVIDAKEQRRSVSSLRVSRDGVGSGP
jgi:Core-2/I-Branching enzyme